MKEVIVASSIDEYRYLCGYFQETVEVAVREGWEFKIEVVYGNKSTTFDTDYYVCDNTKVKQESADAGSLLSLEGFDFELL